jgi:nucleotide-binding universal stress UspA family protein
MYNKVLVPLDGSKESETAVGSAIQQLSPDGELILLKVVAPAKTQTLGGHLITGDQIDAVELSRATAYLKNVMHQIGEEDSDHRRCEAIIGTSVPQAIVDFAARAGVDLIVMYTHDRKGLAGLIKRSIAKQVEQHAPMDVKMCRPQEMAVAT